MLYFDHASTSFPKPPQVVKRICEYLEEYGVSPGRGNHELSKKAHEMVEVARCQLAHFIGIEQPEHLIFTSNATHSINIVLKSFLNKGDHVILCRYSHNAALRPLERLRLERGITYDILSINEDGVVDLEALKKIAKQKTRLLIATEASNTIGVLANLDEAFSFCREKKIHILLDSTQSLGYCSSHVQRGSIDFFVGTGHKTLLGPSGIGFLYVENADNLTTFIEGGSAGNASSSRQHPIKLPFKFEAGTMNATGIAGLLGSLEYIEEVKYGSIAARSLYLTQVAMQALLEIEECVVYGIPKMIKKVPILSFNLKRMLPSQISSELERKYQICTRSGLHCAPLMHEMLNTSPTGTVRVSFGHQNTEEEVKIFINAIKDMVRAA